MKLRHYIILSIFATVISSFTFQKKFDNKTICNPTLDIDTIKNYYILNFTDTIYNVERFDIFKCNYLQSLEKSHNKCKVIINEKLYSGNLIYWFENEEGSTYFNGDISLGLIKAGSMIKYHSDGEIMITGQYSENWKVGIWTTYYESGMIESINMYIKGADYPIIEKEFDKDGNIIYSNNEQKEIESRIKTTTS